MLVVAVVFEYTMSHIGSCSSPLGPQWAVLFGKVTALLGGALLEEVCHWGWVFRFYSLAQLPVLSVSCVWVKYDLLAFHPCYHALPTMMNCTHWDYKPNNLFSPKLLFAMVFS